MTAHSSLLSNGNLTDLLYFFSSCLYVNTSTQSGILLKREKKKNKKNFKRLEETKTEMIKYKDSHH